VSRSRAAWVLLLVVGKALCANAQGKIELRDAGPGIGADILNHALAGRHIVIGPSQVTYVVPRDSILDQTIIVLKHDVVVSGTVRGDVIVVGGDVYMNPGGRIDGRAVAIDGGVYESTLATIGAGVSTYNDFSYDVEAIPGGWALKYHAAADRPIPTFTLPGIYGLRLPTYDRTDGLSLAVAPLVVVPGVGTRIEPRITYRSQLGVVDPSVVIAQPISRVTTLHGEVGRGTFSNDTWIRSNLVNSLAVFWSGKDSRNYYRATRAEASVSRRWEAGSSTIEPFLGGRWERARSVRPDSFALGGPWSFRDRRDKDDMLRPNPQLNPSTIASGIGGAHVTWADNGLVASLRLTGEVGSAHPDCDACGSPTSGTFEQATLEGGISFPTFGLQTLRINAHVVASDGNTPVQRYAYLGGPGTIPSLEMLERGGDQLFFFDGSYDIPLTRITLPLGLSPVLTLREVLAGADVSGFPAIAQITGARLAVSVLYAELLVDPAHRRAFPSVGISIPR
jgi:hypothetical protein